MKGKIKCEIAEFLENKDNKSKIHQNLWDVTKTDL